MWLYMHFRDGNNRNVLPSGQIVCNVPYTVRTASDLKLFYAHDICILGYLLNKSRLVNHDIEGSHLFSYVILINIHFNKEFSWFLHWTQETVKLKYFINIFCIYENTYSVQNSIFNSGIWPLHINQFVPYGIVTICFSFIP